MDNPMRARIQSRLDALHKNPFEVAIAAGLNRHYLHDFMIGKKGTISLKNVPAIAAQLRCDPGYLTGGMPEPTGGAGFGPAGGIEVDGIAEPGAWRQPQSVGVKVQPDPRYRPEDQGAVLVRGDSWRDLGIVDGSVVVYARGIAPRPCDLIVRRQMRGSESQITIERLAVGRDGQNGESDETLGVIVMEVRSF